MSQEIRVRVQPRSSRNRVEWLDDGSAKVWTTAPPVEGEANDAVLRLLADALGVPPRRLELVSGFQGRNKVFRLAD